MEHTSTDSIDGQAANVDRERTTFTEGKHVMLSYNWSSQVVVSQIYQILKDENIPIWFDIQGDMKNNIYDRYGCS